MPDPTCHSTRAHSAGLDLHRKVLPLYLVLILFQTGVQKSLGGNSQAHHLLLG
ncbi:hypothetical protein Mapa_008622 [Marchantia paleacea]|nr:hypothetical protein Mapa_008622 [Marchantia paleacea]